VSFISWIAVGGVTLGVAALVVAMSVMNGYQANLIRAMAGALPHVSLHALLGDDVPEPDQLAPFLGEGLQPTSVSSYALQDALFSGPRPGEGGIQGVLVRAIDSRVESTIPGLLAFLSDGTPAWQTLPPSERLNRAGALLRKLARPENQGTAGVLISPGLAEKLKVRIGENLIPLKFPKKGGGFSPTPSPQRVEVIGHFSTGIASFDELVVLMDIGRVEDVFPGEQRRVALGLRLSDPLQASTLAESLRAALREADRSVYVYSWLEQNRGLFQVIQVQKTMLFLVLMLIVLLALFGMISAMVMMVTEKTREITILKALGARNRQIHRIFRLQGIMIGLMGTVLGLLLGLLACWVLAAFPLFEIPPGVYPGSDHVPVEVAPLDLLWVVLATFIACLLATLVPARKATALEPVEGLRHV